MTAAPEDAVSIAEIQRQFTRYLRDPDNAPLPQGADAGRMRVYARSFRFKLFFGLQRQAPGLVEALGRDRMRALLNDYARLPRPAPKGDGPFADAFFPWLKSEWANHGLPPWTPDLVDYYLAAMRTESLLERPERDAAGEGDLLAGVPIFSELATLLRLEWPAHRIGKDFVPQAKPAEPVWLIVYCNRHDESGYLELNRWAAEIAGLVRDNSAGRTGAELLVVAGTRFPLTEPAALLRDGLGILDTLHQRGIIHCAPARGQALA